MGRKVAFVHDTPLNVDGGAEITSRLVIQIGRNLGYDIHIISQNNKEDFYALSSHDLIILSSIWRFNFETMDLILESIKKVTYVKYEHDHRSLSEMAEDKYPRDSLADPIFRNSALNIFMSPAHKEDHRRVLGADGICIPPLIDDGLFKCVEGIKRKSNTALIGAPHKAFDPIGYLPSNDGGAELKTYIREHPDIHFDYLNETERQDAEFMPRVPHEKMPELYSQYEYFIHLPQGKWSFERLIIESALCGCKVVTNDKAEGMSWGKNLADLEALREWIKQAPYDFWTIIKSKGL
jgi:hypothetical protein